MGWALMLGFILLIIFVSLVIFFEKKDPAKTISWLLIMVFLPGIGFFVYLFFNGNYKKKKIRKTKEAASHFLSDEDVSGILRLHDMTRAQHEALNEDILFEEREMSLKKKVIQLIMESERSPFTTNNQVRIYTEGVEKFEDMLRDIEQAENHIHLEYFIFKNSQIGRRLQQLLIRKANEGVRVRFLYDELGSFRLMFDKKFMHEMKAAGIEIRPFMEIKFPYFHGQFNYRNHRKICVIDGKIGYLGGLNIGDEYIHKNKKFGFWRDTHLRLEGETVYMLQSVFLVDYYLGLGTKLIDENLFPPLESHNEVLLQIASSGPDMLYESIYNAYFSCISRAKETVYIQTPYFIPDEAMMMALKTAIMSGVDVRLMFPSFPDHKVVYRASLSYIEEILALGARVFLYEKGFIHSKTILVDGEVASVGTANMDIRSFMINFEINAFIYDDGIIHELYEIFREDMQNCREMDYEVFRKRGIGSRFIESFARLFSPLL
ncbi:MAG: cardiolipin synthase [Peptostreptococcaceae bacterium]|nr:cardiolipin synthase [Peptostreptococcaceae bacterium]